MRGTLRRLELCAEPADRRVALGDLPTPKLGRRIAAFGAGRAQEKGREALANDVDELGCGTDDVIKLIKQL